MNPINTHIILVFTIINSFITQFFFWFAWRVYGDCGIWESKASFGAWGTAKEGEASYMAGSTRGIPGTGNAVQGHDLECDSIP